ncbi:DUF1338 domain-containing protein [Flavobacterium sp. ASW18X]|uniref:DUF1338 domain-containing protein n=1 Tax=Flavobacterium sp. ASW18X TaxID=2572595 RepID=UPI0010AE1E24|nr:DUF1338 domain-containing protein [Flavobacterium sp. ASW18X]TKD65974.1 DUF1338 domain-containing protein [Flavobacterium sp. ASW18X]
MNFKSDAPLDQILEALFTPYKESVPDVAKIVNAMISKGMIASEDDIINDHIAFRTLGVPNLGISSFEKIFLHHGYTKMAPYHFKEKKLDAFWYAPPSQKYPRIFISELRVNDLSKTTQDIIYKYTHPITEDPIASIDLDNPSMVGKFFYQPLWQLPSLEDYQSLATESEYAAWVIYNRYYLNHYTISVHELPEPFNLLSVFNTFLEEHGIKLNDSGSKIKVSADGLLKQSSSVAKMIPATFAGGETLAISGSYVEFAERLPLAEFAHLPKEQLDATMRREGFEAANADKIFESTYSGQTGK